jgi:hypothetical protein
LSDHGLSDGAQALAPGALDPASRIGLQDGDWAPRPTASSIPLCSTWAALIVLVLLGSPHHLRIKLSLLRAGRRGER